MGNAPSVVVKTQVLSPVTPSPYLQRALITFVPSTAEFLAGFTAATQPWMFQDQNTLLGLVAELGPNNWQSRLLSLGATNTEPVWRAVDAHFQQQSVADSQGNRTRLPLPESVFLGRRTSAAISENTVEFDTNTAGIVRVKVNPAPFIFTSGSPAGSLADVTIVADGVLTTTQLGDALAAALLAIPGFAANFDATNAAGVVTIESLIAGFPLIVEISVSTPGPTMIHTVTTNNVAAAYETDLNEMQLAAEFGSHLNPPTRKWYWCTDLQGDDIVNEEGFKWVEDQNDVSLHNPPRDYQYLGWSTSGGKPLLNLDGDLVGNFDPDSTASAAAVAKAALNNAGWTRGGVHDHDRWEFVVPALLGRTIAFLPGQVSFTSKVLYGATANSRMTPRDYGDNESLSQDRTFNWYGAEGPRGSHRWGYLANSSFIDRKWLEDFCSYIVKFRLIEWAQLKDIVAYIDDDIEAGAGIIAGAMSELPAINNDSIRVTFLRRDQVSSNDIALRIYKFYIAFADTNGVINQIGTLAEPISISLIDA